jgi:hypothetical protein
MIERHHVDHAEIDGGSEIPERQFIATVLLEAVMQSFRPHNHEPRAWLESYGAKNMLLLLDISPSAALESLRKKWENIDNEADMMRRPDGAPLH